MPPDAKRFAVYFSHSWRPRDVALNLQVWDELAGDCELLVDVPDEPGANPPYYINRIEELLWRSDLFISVLTYRQPKEGEFTEIDDKLRCSPYSLFEIRLAERADMTRLILYERSTGFRPPKTIRPWEAYVPFDRVTNEPEIEQRQWTTVVQSKIGQWKDWAIQHGRPMSYEQSTSAFVLGGVNAAVDDTLRNCGYEPVRCDPGRQRSSEVFRALREAGLVVVDFSVRDPVSDQLYAAAHGRGLPAIRMQVTASADQELPWILRGDAGGYQNDIVRGAHPDDLAAQVEPRVKAMFRLSPALRDGSGSEYLQAKRYAQFFVFISHTLKPPERALVNQIYVLLRQRHVTPFEYHEVNAAGIDWRVALRDSLHKTTHFVALLSPDYEQSQTCTYELEEILARKEQVSILPFMVLGRSAPNPKLTQIHNRLLADPDPLVNAQTVVQEVMAALDADLARIAPS